MLNHILMSFSGRSSNIFICILHHLRIYYELAKSPAPRRLDRSVYRAELHWYRKSSWARIPFSPGFILGFYFTTTPKLCLTAMINHVYQVSLQIKNIVFHIFTCLRFFEPASKQRDLCILFQNKFQTLIRIYCNTYQDYLVNVQFGDFWKIFATGHH